MRSGKKKGQEFSDAQPRRESPLSGNKLLKTPNIFDSISIYIKVILFICLFCLVLSRKH